MTAPTYADLAALADALNHGQFPSNWRKDIRRAAFEALDRIYAAQPAEPKDHDCALLRGGCICRECDLNTIEKLSAEPKGWKPADAEEVSQAWADGVFQPQALGGYELFTTGWRAAEEHFGISEQPKGSGE